MRSEQLTVCRVRYGPELYGKIIRIDDDPPTLFVGCARPNRREGGRGYVGRAGLGRGQRFSDLYRSTLLNLRGRGRYRIADRWCVRLPFSVPTVSASAGDVDMSWWRVPAVSLCPPFHRSLRRVMAHSWHTRVLDSQRDPKTHLSKTRTLSAARENPGAATEFCLPGPVT